MDTMIGLQAILIGLGATLLMDGWSWIQRNVFGIASLNYALVARWVLCIPKGKWMHRTILQTPKVAGEQLLGWLLHYAIGIAFAFLLICWAGEHWLADPSLNDAVVIGMATLCVPFLLIQPCLGFGVAASKTPMPWRARVLSFITHLVYGTGLFISAEVLRWCAG